MCSGKIRREFCFFEEFDGNPEQIFHGTFGNRCFTFRNLNGSSEHSASGFEWKEHSYRTNKWRTASDDESDNEDHGSCCVGSSSDRTILGLPSTGPLKIEDVKNA